MTIITGGTRETCSFLLGKIKYAKGEVINDRIEHNGIIVKEK